MKNKKMIFISLCTFLFTSLAFSQDERRLIQYGPSIEDRAWMNESEMNQLSQKSHAAGRCPGFADITDFPQKMNRIDNPNEENFSGIFNLAPIRQDSVNELLPQLSADNLRQTVATLSQNRTRHYRSTEGVAAARWIAAQFQAYSSHRNDITVSSFAHRFSQPSIIARMEGHGPNANEVIVIGAHEDSINQNPFSNAAPGADDDASGVATVLEIFRVLAQSGFQPNRTIDFITYAGEEAGLLGSQDIAEKYKAEHVQVVATIQFDMTMYPSSTRKITLIEDHTSPELTRFLGQLIDTYVHHEWITDSCGYGCSDHASWHSAGFASSFPFESPSSVMNPAIHSTSDVISALDMDFGLHFAKLGLAFLVELENAQ